MQWTTSLILTVTFLASFTRAAEFTRKEITYELETDSSIPEKEGKVLSIGNAEGLGVFLVQLSTLTVLSLSAVYCIYVVFLPSVSSRSLSWSPWDMLGQANDSMDNTKLLRMVADSFDSVNARIQSDDRVSCRKLSMCQMASITSKYMFLHTILQVLRPVFPQIDESWDGLEAGEARQDCNLLYPECPMAIMRAVFSDAY